MATVGASRLTKFLEAVYQFSEEALLMPEDEWLAVRAIDRPHITAAFGKLRLEEPVYEKFAINLRHALRFLKSIRGEVQLKLEDRKLVIKGNGFVLKIDTIDPDSLKPVSEPSLTFDLSADVEIPLLVDVLKHLRRVDVITFVADKDGLRIEAKTETTRYSQWLGTPTFLNSQVPEVRVNFLRQFLIQIVNALSVLSRPPNATFSTIELRSNYPARFTLTDDDLHFRAYIAPRLD